MGNNIGIYSLDSPLKICEAKSSNKIREISINKSSATVTLQESSSSGSDSDLNDRIDLGNIEDSGNTPVA